MYLIDLIKMRNDKKKMPYRVMIGSEICTYGETINDYRNERTGYGYFSSESFFTSDLFRKKVEVIEEDKLEKINCKRLTMQSKKNKLMIQTINKLIDKIDELEKKQK
ncbi:MAG: hypothetical protein Q4E39_05135 [bacterium]|nr:hypothetical protein [bacterium]